MSNPARRIARPGLWLLGIVLLAALVRLVGLEWDQRHFFHPDERRIAMAIGEMSFEPLQLNPRFFAYGSLPFYITRAITSALGNIDPSLRHYDFVILTGRAVSAIFGTLTVWLVALLGARLYNREVGLLGALLLALTPLHIQNSHFVTTDVILTFWVLLALYTAVGIVQRGRPRDYVYTGLALGLGLATKVAALPLLAPIGLAGLVRLARERRPLRVMGLGLLTVAVAFGAFVAGEPYALVESLRAYGEGGLDAAFNTQFFRDVAEQSRMVRNAGIYPYTNQYVGTPKYGYELQQMILWCMAPPLGLAVLWATLRRPLRAWRTRSAEDLVLLGFVLPFFIVTGWFEVKFPRYLLPIYPVVILWAADWLWRGTERWLGRLRLWVVAVGTALAGLAFLSIYQSTHSVVAASEWVYAHIEPGSTILTQHWDEGFPMPLPGGRHPGRYTVKDLPYYEGLVERTGDGWRESRSKITALAENLAAGDYLAFQTKRLYGAITQAAEKYPLTNKYFYLLFAGDLGYELIYDHASRPQLLGFEFPDELADESLTVYDHPKVLIFENVERLSADELAARIRTATPSIALTRRDLLLATTESRAEGGAQGSAPIRSSWMALLWFAAVTELLGVAAFGFVQRWIPHRGSYAAAKVLGVLGFAWLTWLLTSLGQIAFARDGLALIFVVLLLAGLATRRRWVQRPEPTEWWLTEAVFWVGFGFFLLMRAFNPEVFWGEKPMDFAFLNTLTRTTTLPPPEPWFAGSHLNYTYFGHYVVAALGKLCHIHPGVTFNLGVALAGGLTTVAAFALGCAATRRWGAGLLAALLTTGLGNLAGLREYVARDGRIDFHYFWATSRVVKDTINEYPLWSFLFADLHAHMLVMPFSVTFLALTVWWARRHEEGIALRAGAVFALLAITLGAITVTNGWSTPTYVLLFPFVMICVVLAQPGIGAGRVVLRLLVHALAPAVILAGLAVLAYAPFWLAYTAPPRNFGIEPVNFVNTWDFANVFGLFLIVGGAFVFAVWRRLLRRADGHLPRPRAVATWAVALAVLGCFALALPWVSPVTVGPLTVQGSVRAGLIVLGLLALYLATWRVTATAHRLALALYAFAFFVTAGCDVVYVWDRMNTLFKFYLDSWFMFAGASAVALPALWRGWHDLFRSRVMFHVWRTLTVAALLLAAFTAVTASLGAFRTQRVPTPRPTLDGTAYIAERDPHEYAAYEWLNENVPGIPVIAEAHGPSYQDFSRVTMNTGLPTVLGWSYHVEQRSQPTDEIRRRTNALERLYTTDDPAIAERILERYHIALVFVGSVERRVYKGGNYARFEEWDELLDLVYENRGVRIFGVVGQYGGSLPVTRVQAVPYADEPDVAVAAPDGQLRQPRGVAVDSEGFAYVADFDNHRIQKYSPDLTFVAGWGEPGNLPGQFKQPCGIAVSPADEVYVLDTWNARVQVFDREGNFLREFGGAWFGPRGIAVTEAGAIYITDTGNHRVRRFTADGDEDRSWGGHGSGPSQFKEPNGIAVAPDGRVYVADNGNGQLKVFGPNGRYLSAFPVPGWRPEVFSEPKLALSPSGTLWVTVPLERAVREYTPEGELLREITGRENRGAPFATPLGIAYNRVRDALVVTDLENRVVPVPLGGT